jgi:hypothetical protein
MGVVRERGRCEMEAPPGKQLQATQDASFIFSHVVWSRNLVCTDNIADNEKKYSNPSA